MTLRHLGKSVSPCRYVADLEPGTELVGKVEILEKMDPSSSLPDLPAITKADSISVEPASISQETFEKLLREPLNVVWPPVHSGNTSGKLSIYISADRESNIREAYPLNSDNAGLQDAARDQCRCWDGSGRKRHELRGGSVPEPLGLAQALGQEL